MYKAGLDGNIYLLNFVQYREGWQIGGRRQWQHDYLRMSEVDRTYILFGPMHLC